MSRVACTLVVIALILILPAQAAELSITQPSANETRIAELRDFYVYGIFTGTVTNPGDIRIEVYKDDKPPGPRYGSSGAMSTRSRASPTQA